MGIVAVLVFGIALSMQMPLFKSSVTPPNSNSTLVSKPHLSLAFFLDVSNPYYYNNLKIFKKNLRDGDYLFISGRPSSAVTVLQKTEQSKPLFNSRIHVDSAIFYDRIDDMVNTVPKLPKGIDFIVYDYEKGTNYSSEFTSNESTSIGFFDQARNTVIRYDKDSGSNAKLIVTPPYGELLHSGWNWGLAAKHMDVIDMQVQSLLKNPSLMKSSVSNIVGQIKETSSNTLIFVQLSLIKTRGSVQDNVLAINLFENQSINSILIWYGVNQTSDLERFFHFVS